MVPKQRYIRNSATKVWVNSFSKEKIQKDKFQNNILSQHIQVHAYVLPGMSPVSTGSFWRQVANGCHILILIGKTLVRYTSLHKYTGWAVKMLTLRLIKRKTRFISLVWYEHIYNVN